MNSRPRRLVEAASPGSGECWRDALSRRHWHSLRHLPCRRSTTGSQETRVDRRLRRHVAHLRRGLHLHISRRCHRVRLRLCVPVARVHVIRTIAVGIQGFVLTRGRALVTTGGVPLVAVAIQEVGGDLIQITKGSKHGVILTHTSGDIILPYRRQ